MLISVLFILVIAAGGFALTYLIESDEPFLWRVAAGTVIGSAVFGTLIFILAMFFGLNAATVVTSLLVGLIPLKLILSGDRRKAFQHDWAKATGKLQGATWTKALRGCYYGIFLMVFVFFFDRTMIETDQGIFTGGSNNLGDLPFHLGAIFSFTDGANFPPQNPSFAGAKFSYPFIADLITAAFMKLGVGVKDAMLVQNVAWAFSLLAILERFVLKLTNDRLASKIAPTLLFLSGGLGFIWFSGDFGAQAKSFSEFIWHLPKDYTIGQDFRWGNSLITLFMTQRSLLLGMPLTLIVLGVLWRMFSFENVVQTPVTHVAREEQGRFSFSMISISPALILTGMLAGLLVLIHLHSLLVLFVVSLFLLILKPEKVRIIEWVIFGACVAVVALPELLWSISASATETTKFFSWHFGWDSGETNFVWFWIKNTGILLPLIALGLYGVYSTQRLGSVEVEKSKNEKGKGVVESSPIHHSSSLLMFYLPFVFLFLISNVAKLAPWEWDNIKVLIYWFVGSIPFVAVAVSWMWRKTATLKIVAACCFLVLIFSGTLDVWRTASGQIKNGVFDADGVLVAERIKRSTPPHALFLNAPTYNSAIVLSGRQSLMRYPGHLGSHGIDYRQREDDLRQIYMGTELADLLLKKLGINFVLIDPTVRNYAQDPNRPFKLNEEFFRKFPVVAEAGQYKVYKIE